MLQHKIRNQRQAYGRTPTISTIQPQISGTSGRWYLNNTAGTAQSASRQVLRIGHVHDVGVGRRRRRGRGGPGIIGCAGLYMGWGCRVQCARSSRHVDAGIDVAQGIRLHTVVCSLVDIISTARPHNATDDGTVLYICWMAWALCRCFRLKTDI